MDLFHGLMFFVERMSFIKNQDVHTEEKKKRTNVPDFFEGAKRLLYRVKFIKYYY